MIENTLLLVFIYFYHDTTKENGKIYQNLPRA